MFRSLRTRLLLAASVLLLGFASITGLVLEQAFQNSLKASTYQRLMANVYALLTAADELEPGQLFLPEMLREDRFNQLQSGLYGLVRNAQGDTLWSSFSATGTTWPRLDRATVGESLFTELKANNRRYFMLSYGVIWESLDGSEHRYWFYVLEDQSAFLLAIKQYRTTLWGWLGAMVAVLLLLQFWLLHWGLTPLRKVAASLRAIEDGKAERLEGRFPTELEPLTDNLNLLLASERAQRQRYQNTMDNLAHSLKTPLAVMRGVLDAPDTAPTDKECDTLSEQIQRMSDIVGYQLKKAVVAAPARLLKSVSLDETVHKLKVSLEKVYAEKAVIIDTDVPKDLPLKIDQGDLYEILGNTLDNACKWAKSKVVLAADPGQQFNSITIDDDGPGIPPQKRKAILNRGQRLDESTEGQGIGLAVVSELVAHYQGQLRIERSELGGARIVIQLP